MIKYLWILVLACVCACAQQVTTQMVVKPSIQEGLSTAQAVAPLFGPWANVVTGAVTLLGAFLGAYARRRTVQLQRSSTTLEAVVAGVEAATRALDPKDAERVKGTIQSQAKIAGVQQHLDPVVQQVTK